MSHLEKVLREFAEETRDAARRELGSQKIGKNRTYGVATRKLQKSLTFSIQGSKVSFGSPLPYAAFIHWGVNGTQKKRGSSYSFRNETKLPVPAIIDWMKAKGIRPRDKNGRFIANIGPRGGDRVASAAYLIARSIKRKGIAGIYYWTTAFEIMLPRFRKKVAEAAGRDIADQIRAKVGNITITPK